MRRTASEILRNLENRVARLERQSMNNKNASHDRLAQWADFKHPFLTHYTKRDAINSVESIKRSFMKEDRNTKATLLEYNVPQGFINYLMKKDFGFHMTSYGKLAINPIAHLDTKIILENSKVSEGSNTYLITNLSGYSVTGATYKKRVSALKRNAKKFGLKLEQYDHVAKVLNSNLFEKRVGNDGTHYINFK